MKRVITSVILAGLLLTSCGNASITTESSESSVEMVITQSSESTPENSTTESSEETETESSSDTSTEPIVEENEPAVQNEVGGGNNTCQEHTYSYHAVDGSLIDFVGQESVNKWYESISGTDQYHRANEDFSIVAFVNEFDLPKEDFIRVSRENITDDYLEQLGLTLDEYLIEYGYTDEQIDAIYSGDQAQINKAFCGNMAYYNEADGQLYSIYWLSDYTAEDYAAADLPIAEITRILDAAEAAGGGYAALAQAATVQAQTYADIAE